MRVALVEYDPSWSAAFEEVARCIVRALGPAALRVEHVGSTSIRGLAAKPVIDVVLIVAEAACERDYTGALESEGFAFHFREPEWHEHRLFKGVAPGILEVNLHIFSDGCVEVERMVRFRDHLRTHPDERALYEQTKRALAAREWARTQEYADAKAGIVNEILRRAGIDQRSANCV